MVGQISEMHILNRILPLALVVLIAVSSESLGAVQPVAVALVVEEFPIGQNVDLGSSQTVPSSVPRSPSEQARRMVRAVVCGQADICPRSHVLAAESGG